MTDCKSDCGDCGCSDEYLLAVIRPGDKVHFLFEMFLESLPEDKKVKFESKDIRKGDRTVNYMIIAASGFEGADKRYFHRMWDCNTFNIKNLSIHEYFKQMEGSKEGEMNEVKCGSVSDMLRQYGSLSNTDAGTILKRRLECLVEKSEKEEGLPEHLQTAKQYTEQFFKESGVWKKKTRLVAPTNITLTLNCGDMTLEEKDLGTYVGALNNLKRMERD